MRPILSPRLRYPADLSRCSMPLVTFAEIESERNIDLTDPQGQAIATTLIAGLTAAVAKYVGYPIEAAAKTEYFDEGEALIYLGTKAPISSLEIAFYNSLTNTYDTLDTTQYRQGANGAVQLIAWPPCAFQGVRASYTTGWTSGTLPKDLREALIDLVTLKLQQINNLSLDPATYGLTDEQIEAGETAAAGQVSRVQSDTYSEEYDSNQSSALWKAKVAQLSKGLGDDIPQAIKEVLDGYKLVFAL